MVFRGFVLYREFVKTRALCTDPGNAQYTSVKSLTVANSSQLKGVEFLTINILFGMHSGGLDGNMCPIDYAKTPRQTVILLKLLHDFCSLFSLWPSNEGLCTIVDKCTANSPQNVVY